VAESEKYGWKEIPGSSHDLLRRRIQALPPGLRLLDLGAAGGHLGRAVRDRCAYLAGVEPDPDLPASCREGYDDWRAKDALSAGDWGAPFDAVVCADVLEHLPRPEELLARIHAWLRPRGTLLVSVPNVANLTVRAALVAGRFPYADRGILDRTHLRFYTRRSARELISAAGFRVRAMSATAMPYELAIPALGRQPLSGPVRAFASASARIWPALFGYQSVIEAERS
jgi:2-polyprenyl-3-methyl-5-hydroxy-6-metoxy-1,4-benzoquinol methylase